MSECSPETWIADSFASVPDGDFEGFDVAGLVREVYGTIASAKTVLDFGCGRGRFTKCFSNHEYLGYDWNPDALAEAAIRNEGYKFIYEPNPTDVWVALHVLMHNSDEWVAAWEPECRFLMIGEVMDKRYRRGDAQNGPPAWNRDLSDYEDVWGTAKHVRSVPIPRYPDTMFTLAVWDRQ